jgi:hypothetical protein
MKRALQLALVLLCLALCGICVLQWKRESELNAHIRQLNGILLTENDKRLEAEKKAQQYAAEIERVNALRAELEEKLLAQLEELLEKDCSIYERSYAAYVAEGSLKAIAAEVSTAAAASQSRAAVMTERNTTVSQQNAAIEKQNTALKQLVAERDTLAEKLNARTKEFNELAEKYNKLVR